MELSNEDLEYVVRTFRSGASREKAIRSESFLVPHQLGEIHVKHAQLDLKPEYQALRRAEAVSDGTWTRAIPPLGYHAESNLLCTLQVGGESLFNAIWNESGYLRRPFAQRSSWPEIMQDIAAWIVRLHADAPAPDVSREKIRDGILKSLVQKSAAIDKDHTKYVARWDHKAVIRFAEESRKSGEWSAEATAQIHGDLTLSNFLKDGQHRIWVLDFGDVRTGFALEDHIRLWSGIWELSRCGSRRNQLMSPCLEPMLETWGIEQDRFRSPPAVTLRVLNAVTRVCELCCTGDRMSRGTRRLVRRLVEPSVELIGRLVFAS